MATLYGQNLRVWTSLGLSDDAPDARIIACATNCTIQYTADTQDLSHKDILNMFNNPAVSGLRCQVTTEALDVENFSLILRQILNKEPVFIMWDESGGTLNQTPTGDDWRGSGMAYISDMTLNANNRELATLSTTFTITGAVRHDDQTQPSDEDEFINTWGEQIRLVLRKTSVTNAVIAAALQLSFHVSVSLEDSTTKDTSTSSGKWVYVEPTSISYDISSTALVRSGETILSQKGGISMKEAQDMFEMSEGSHRWGIGYATGTNNRDVDEIVNGQAIITSLQLNGPNRQRATYSIQLQGVGAYSLSSNASHANASNNSDSVDNGG